MQLIKSVNFGSRKGGLATVGYTLYNSDGSVKQVRTTTGVFEVITDEGMYACLITFDDDWKGLVVWDTGEATPLYAIADFNFGEYKQNIYTGE